MNKPLRTSFETTEFDVARASAPPSSSNAAPSLSRAAELAPLLSEQTPARGRLAVDLLRTLGTRLKSDERAPYDLPEHDDTVNFDDPTDDLILIDATSGEKK